MLLHKRLRTGSDRRVSDIGPNRSPFADTMMMHATRSLLTLQAFKLASMNTHRHATTSDDAPRIRLAAIAFTPARLLQPFASLPTLRHYAALYRAQTE